MTDKIVYRDGTNVIVDLQAMIDAQRRLEAEADDWLDSPEGQRFLDGMVGP